MRNQEVILEKEQHKRLIEIFRGRGISQNRLARELGISPPHLSRIIQGKATPSKLLMEKIITQLGVDRGWLFRGEGENRLRPLASERHELTELIRVLEKIWPLIPGPAERYSTAAEIFRVVEPLLHRSAKLEETEPFISPRSGEDFSS